MMESLQILHGDTLVGALVYDRKKDAVSLAYEASWQFGADGFPVSLSLPLERKVHSDERVRPFLQGLLPDNPAMIEAWAKRFQISPRNPFDVIRNVGEDCAGALQFVRPERLERILSGELDSLILLSEDDLEKRMVDLHSQARSIPALTEGRFSLAGAQTKDALFLKDGRWHVPTGRIPSTHILKPELEEFDHHALNEHFCLLLASRAGLIRAESSLLNIAGKRVLCVKRYDRFRDEDGTIRRVHQEDTCQAFGRYPNQKYQADGGPSAAEIVGILRQYSDHPLDDIARFVMALAFNWVIAGTDAHAKNYSLLHGAGSCLRLAPLYDLASYLPYQRDAKSTKVKLAMKIGSTYRLHEIDSAQWKKWAKEAGLTEAEVVSWVEVTIERVRASLKSTRAAVAETNDSRFLQTLANAIEERADKLGGSWSNG
ncbi:MAG: serine/threonine protein kinase [Verrucomicrobiales bacterium VVV1]|nr:MAG: serine/threonine protein kinase [Verrucomicrobiales bacterium VVV1]